MKALQALLHGLAPSVNRFWVEKGFVALIWVLMTSDTCSQKSLDLIKEAVQRLDEHENGPLSEEATNAVLIVSFFILWLILSITYKRIACLENN